MKNKKLLSTLSIGLMAAVTSSSLLAAELRPLAADRPDATESPQTVDKGHWQIETSILGFAQDRSNGVTSRSYQAFNSNVKYGLSDSVDLHLVWTPYVKEEVEQNGNKVSDSSYSDIELRSKINLWGNDGGDSAMALLPYLKLPSGDFSNDEVEGGLIVTYGTDLSGFGVGVQAQLDYLYDGAADEMAWAGSHTAVLGYDIDADTGGYVEYIGEWDLKDDYIPYGSFGFTHKTSANTQWDIGSKFALDNQGQDFEIFFGLTQRY